MKVFLSSTYIDLIEYRKAAKDALERLGQQVGGMEIFGARDEEPKKVALKEIEKCQLVIGIYAHRYGSILDGDELSITEQEFLHAKEKGIPVFCFLVDEDQLWPPKMIEKDSAKIKKLEEFKAKVLKEKTVEFFTTPDNLAKKVVTAVHNHFEELKATEEARQAEVNVHVGGNFNGNLVIGDHNNSNVNQSLKPTGSTLPHQPYFFGRAKELEIIASALSPDSRTWGALIDGPGGIGKTALAIKAAHDAPAELFERKIFITAKVRELNPEGEAKLTDFTRPTYLAMLDELGKELGADGLEKLAPDERPNELRLALAGKKALIIFDNLETLPEEERTRLFQFLSRLPEGNKAIVTSRRRTDVDARIMRLDRLARDEALQLIAELAAKYPRLARATQKEREELYEITQGNPLFIRWIAGQLGREGSQCRTIADACAFIDKTPKGNDPLEYIFGDLLETFTAGETKVLAALTHFTQPAKLKWIADMTSLPERAAETALEDLTDRSILTSDLPAQTYFLPPLTAKFIRNKRAVIVNETTEHLINKAYTLVMENGFDKYKNFPILEIEWGFVASALPYFPITRINQIMDMCNALGSFLNETERLDEAIKLNEETEQKLLSLNDLYNAGWYACAAGYAYHKRREAMKVFECANRAETHWQNAGARELGIAYRIRGLGYQLEQNFDAAISTFNEAIKFLNTANPESSYVALVLNDLGKVESTAGFYEKAVAHYNEALRLTRKKDNNNRLLQYTLNLIDLLLLQEKWTEAESLTRESLALAEKVGRQELIAVDCHRLAKAIVGAQHAVPQPVTQRDARLQEALALARRAIEIYTRLRHPSLQSAQEFLAEIEEELGKS